MPSLLSVRDVTSGYGDFQVLWGVSFDMARGDVLAILGPNGCGKSTLMGAISGVRPSWSGSVTFDGRPMESLPAHMRVKYGVSHVLERRRLFPFMTVMENLLLGSLFPEARARRSETLDWVYGLFPILKARTRQLANSLSGGEQQMLAVARGLMSHPSLLLLDEPLLGLAPSHVRLVIDVVHTVHAEGITVAFIEQNVDVALEISSQCLLLRDGRVVLYTPTSEIDTDVAMAIYLGGDPEAMKRRKGGDHV